MARYFDMEFHASCRACDLLWAEDAAAGRPGTWVHDFFRGMQGQVWFGAAADADRFQAILDREAIPYTVSDHRTDSDPFVEPFIAVQEGK